MFDALGVAAAEDNMVGDEGLLESGHDSSNLAFPVFQADALESGVSEKIFYGLIVDVREIAEFQ
jgi:hypothetical protein